MSPFGLGSRKREPQPAENGRPILAVDIDGVVSLFGFDEQPRGVGAEMELIDGALHCISMPAGERLGRLAADYEMVWATGWERGGERIAELLDLPRWPALRFKGALRFGSADWKLEPLGRYAQGRPLAWIDDSFDEACYAWARSRREPTLLVDTEPEQGLQEVHVEALLGWARSLGAESPEAAGRG